MGRKRTRFDWTEEDGFAERVERPNRKVLKAEIKELERLALQLATMPAAERARLPLEPHVQDALTELARLGRGPALKRQRLRVTTLLMDVDREALDAALDGHGEAQEHLWALERWRTRILDEGDEAVAAFADRHPGADRQRLRQLARQASGEGDGPARARKRLFAALRQAGPPRDDDDA